jgi:hypothetical protein
MFDPTYCELRDELDRCEDCDEFEKAEAIYWFAHDYHGGQSSNLYEVLCQSEFRPGIRQSGIDPQSIAGYLYNHLVALRGWSEV